MGKLKSIIFVVGIMLLILAAAMGYLSFRYLSAILPTDSYEDKGVYTFSPYQVLPVQVQNTGASGRDRRMNPTKTAYMVYYQDISGSGYQWSEQALTRELGQKIVDAKQQWSGGCWRFPLTAPISLWSRIRLRKATQQDFGKSTSLPSCWRVFMSCCMWRRGA